MPTATDVNTDAVTLTVCRNSTTGHTADRCCHPEEQYDGAHGRGENPVSEHGHGEGEGHTEHGHDEICHGKVDEEPAQVSTRPASSREHNDCQHVTDYRERGGDGIKHYEDHLVSQRQA